MYNNYTSRDLNQNNNRDIFTYMYGHNNDNEYYTHFAATLTDEHCVWQRSKL